jgi:uncharacterized membrane protein
MHKEKRSRSLIKAITYRLISIVIDSGVAYAITKSSKQTLLLVVASNTISMVVYFIHERAWNRVHWGKHTIEIETDPVL